ncbi:hypothetical protein M8C21_027885, partial [Ambrosia artemisiifolia]
KPNQDPTNIVTMQIKSTIFILSFLTIFCFKFLHATNPPLSLDYYKSSCPNAEAIVRKEMECVVQSDLRNAALILRLHFHDCFVQVGGPYWDVPVGRKDSKTASYSQVESNFPRPNDGLLSIISKFMYQSLSVTDMVALSGAHTIGMARCTNYRARIYGDYQTTATMSNIAEPNLKALKSTCPAAGGGDNNEAPMDYVSPKLFDNTYYHILLRGEGLLNSDQELYSSVLGVQTSKLVRKYAEDQIAFFEQFSESMVKMGNITNPETYVDGEVRKNC